MRYGSPIAVLGLLSMAACSPKYYVPTTQNVPLISEKGQLDLNVNGNDNQVSFQGAYGATNGLALQLNGSLVIPADDGNGNGGSGSMVEIGVGYFRPITERWIFETYGLFGTGHMENHFPNSVETYPGTNGKISAMLYRYGIQPDFGYRSKHFFAGVSTRLMAVTYAGIEGSLVHDGVAQAPYLRDNSTIFLIEPALTLKGGFEWVKLQVQLGYSLNVGNMNFPNDRLLTSIGLNFHLQTRKERKVVVE